MRMILGCVLMAVMVAGVSADDKEEKIDIKKLIGKWKQKDATKGGGKEVIEFAKDGKVSVSFGGKDKELKFNGTYKVEENKVTATMKEDGKEESKTVTVTKLTDTELTLKDDRGEEETFLRIKDK
jgi:uncharacterized protein (TIGR03066 family)